MSDSIEVGLAEFFINLLKDRNFEFPKSKTPDVKKWAREFDLMIRLDGRNPEQIKTVIRWSQQDNFWRANILSPAKLRKQWSQLTEKMKAEIVKGGRPEAKDSGKLVQCGCRETFNLLYQGQECTKCSKPYYSQGHVPKEPEETEEQKKLNEVIEKVTGRL